MLCCSADDVIDMSSAARPILVVVGSVRQGRHGVNVAKMVGNALAKQGLEADIVGERERTFRARTGNKKNNY